MVYKLMTIIETTMQMAMSLRIKTCLVLVSLLLVVFVYSSGKADGFGIDVNSHSTHEGGMLQVNSRKLLLLDAVLDYDYAGPNVKHDPRGKRGGGGRNR